MSQEPGLFNDTIRANIAIWGRRWTEIKSSIARAIVMSRKITLLDEVTSALDAVSERVVQDVLYQVMINRTTVVIAHCLLTIKNADVIKCK